MLVLTLETLFNNGLIEADTSNPGIFDKLDRQQIEVALDQRTHDPDNRTTYRLTVLGGQQWESFAAPDWSLYVSDSAEFLDDKRWRAECMCTNKERLQQYFRILPYIKYDIDQTSIMWDTLQPWEATYWKTLPLAHRVTFIYQQDDDWSSDDIPASYQWLYQNKWYSWH